MEELNEWKEQITLDEYNKLIEFVNLTKNKQKINNKFLFLVGNIQKAVKLVIDIEDAISIDDCEYIDCAILEDIFVPDKEEYILQSDYLNAKCLTIEVDNEKHFLTKRNIIKEIISSDYNNGYFKFNTIIISENIPDNKSILERAIKINLG